MSTKAKWINSITDTSLRWAIWNYNSFTSWKNHYDDIDSILTRTKKDNIYAFISWDIWAIIAYPKIINEINEQWFNKNLLRATFFPEFINDSQYLVNYNYFVINKNSINQEMSNKLLTYIFSEEWEKELIKDLKYFLPARLSLYDELKDQTIHENFYIKLKHFYNPNVIYSSFDKWIKTIYDYKINDILDNPNPLHDSFSFFKQLQCKTIKILKLENLNKPCD
jgi:ABC-type glycerol-3-phosphate transport system substrate-binding protein